MKWKHLILFFAIFTALFSCTRTDAPSHEEDMLYRVECFYQQNPDSALQILDTLDVSALSDKEQAHYCLLKANSKDLKRQNDAEKDSLFQVAANYFIRGKDKYYEAMTYFFLSGQHNLKGEGKQTVLDYRLKALQSIEQCHHVDERLIRFSPTPTDEKNEIDRVRYAIHQRLGMSYAESGYFRESINHLKQADNYYDEKENIRCRLITSYPLGMAYLCVNEYDSCLMYYQIGLHYAEMMDDAIETSYYHSALASYYIYCYETQHYESEEDGVNLLHQAVEQCHLGFDGMNFSNAPIYNKELFDALSLAYFDLQQYDSCIYYGRIVEELNVGIYDFTLLHKRLYQSYKALGDEKNAAIYAEKLIESSINSGVEQKAVAEVKAEYDKQLELQRMESEQQLKRYRLYLWIALLAILLMALLGVAFRYRKNKELEMLKLHEAQRQLQADLDQLTVQRKEALLQQAMTIYQSGQKDRLQHIMEAFESAYPEGVEKIQSAYPDLNKTELYLVVLLFLQFRIKEEADLLGLSENTVMRYRSNLRKKVNIEQVPALMD